MARRDFFRKLAVVIAINFYSSSDDRTQFEEALRILTLSDDVSVRLHDGRNLSLLIQAPKGSSANPFAAEEHEARFARELTECLPNSVVSEIVNMSKDLDGLDARWLGQALSVA